MRKRMGAKLACLVIMSVGAGGCRDDSQPAPAATDVGPGVLQGTGNIAIDAPTVEVLMARGEFEAALVSARDAAAKSPRDAQAFFDLASAALATKRHDEALDAVRAGIRFAPERAAGYLLRGVVHANRGDLLEAERSWQEALGRNPSIAEGNQARLQLAELERAREAYVGEERWLRQALEATPDNIDIRMLLVVCLVAQGNTDGARTLALDVVARDPRRFEAQRLLAALAWDRESYSEALERGAIAVRLNEEDEVSRRLLEGAFYVEAATRLRCAHGARPWSEEAVIAVLRGMEKDFAMEGAASFVELDRQFQDDAGVAERLGAAAARICPATDRE